ncbi:MAG: SDR family oxidoreductase [Propionibacteriaceae bacterium]|jgi:nucleoside-diphosphate-sugar epimerase|nr:SDR family oxidoreductase [Propionibacteriaceae bacterium]
MRVFVTGGSGWIGAAVVRDLIAAGHEVLGLARSEAAAAAITAAGAEPTPGDLNDPASIRSGARRADGVIHLAFGNDFTDIQRCMDEEALAVEAFAAALTGSGKPLVFASGTPATPGHVSLETDPFPIEGPLGGRARSAQAVLDLAQAGVRSAVVRLPRSVHAADGRYGFASTLIAAAQRSGVSGYVGDGTQRWPAVHRLDAARLFRLALENAAPGTVAHAVADEGDTMLSLAQAIGWRLGLPVKAVAAETFGFLGQVFAADQPSSSALTQARFGWTPTHPSLLDDLANGVYPS